MYLTFNASFEGAFKPPDKGEKIYDDWKSFIEGYLPKDDHHMFTMMFAFKVMQDLLLKEAIKNIFVSLLVAWIVLALVTWNWYVALLGMINIAFIMVLFMGLWPILGWELDIFNIIYLIMCVGLSVDYTVHLLHAFNESPGNGREERMKDALSEMGITILSGALTTLLAALPLFGCTSTFLKRFGTFIFLCIFFSICTAILLLTPLVLLIGPNGSFGDIKPFYWLRDKMKERGNAKVAPGGGDKTHDEGEKTQFEGL
jgi:predicted RND superfamily exporter protein